MLQLVSHKSEMYEHNMKELELLKDQLDESVQDETGDNNAVEIKIVWNFLKKHEGCIHSFFFLSYFGNIYLISNYPEWGVE